MIKNFIKERCEIMHKEKLLKQLSDVLEDGTDVEKVKITYKNGEVLKIAFDDDDEDEDDEDDEDEDEDEDEDDEKEDDDKDVVVEDNDAIQEVGWKVKY